MPVKKVIKEESCCEGSCCGKCVSKNSSCNNSSCAVYGIGLIGAVVYYFQHADTASDYVMGLLKSFAWPAMLVYKALELLKF